jgi:hypothetical protein
MMVSGVGIVVENTAHRPKVEGLSGRVKVVNKDQLNLQSVIGKNAC